MATCLTYLQLACFVLTCLWCVKQRGQSSSYRTTSCFLVGKARTVCKSLQRLHSLRPLKVSKCPGHTNCILATIPVAYGKSADISAHYCSTAVSPALSHPKQNLLWIIPLLLCRPAQCFLENGLGAGGILWALFRDLGRLPGLAALRTCPPFSPKTLQNLQVTHKSDCLEIIPMTNSVHLWTAYH